MWVGERCFRPARNAGAAGGYRESTLQGSTGSHWEPLTAGLGSLWGGLSPLHRHSFPGGLCTPDQAQGRPSAGPSAPQSCAPGAAENKPGAPKRSRGGGAGLGDDIPRVPSGWAPRGRWWGWTSTPRSASPLLLPHLPSAASAPRGDTRLRGGGSGGCRVSPDRGFAAGMGRILPAPSTGAGMRRGRRSGTEGCGMPGAGGSGGAPRGQAGMSR